MHAADEPRHADEALDAPKLEGRLLLDDHPGSPIDFDDVADFDIGPVPVANPVLPIFPPQDNFESWHLRDSCPRSNYPRGLGGDALNIHLVPHGAYTMRTFFTGI